MLICPGTHPESAPESDSAAQRIEKKTIIVESTGAASSASRAGLFVATIGKVLGALPTIPMASIRFVSKDYLNDKMIDAADLIGKRLLDVATAHEVPIFSACRKGQCGGCLVEIEMLSMPMKHRVELNHAEIDALSASGKLTAAQCLRAMHNGIPTPYRLACQYVVQDEDILVRYREGVPAESRLAAGAQSQSKDKLGLP